MNGDSTPPPLELAVGQRHRLRFVNTGAAGLVRFSLTCDTSLVRWRAVAKDGADLPAVAAVDGPATARVNVGETFDAAFNASEPGEYELAFELNLRPGVRAPIRRQRVIVREARARTVTWRDVTSGRHGSCGDASAHPALVA